MFSLSNILRKLDHNYEILIKKDTWHFILLASQPNADWFIDRWVRLLKNRDFKNKTRRLSFYYCNFICIWLQLFLRGVGVRDGRSGTR